MHGYRKTIRKIPLEILSTTIIVLGIMTSWYLEFAELCPF
jgi:hypothetical protein